jgi:hypothetical protein
MHKYILAIQNLLVFICISCITKSNIIKEIKKTKKMFFASYEAMIAFPKVEPAFLEENIISLDFVAKCVNFFNSVVISKNKKISIFLFNFGQMSGIFFITPDIVTSTDWYLLQ